MAKTWNEQVAGTPDITKDYAIVDTDTHLNEWPDLWTSRAPAKYKDRVPHVKRVKTNANAFGDGVGEERIADMWFVEGDKQFGSFGAVVVNPSGGKLYGKVSYDNMDDMHPAAWDVKERVKFMDQTG